MKDRSAERREMVATSLVRRGLHNQAILDAFLAVPRELFVPARFAASAYEDRPLPIEAGQTISQPYVVALMLDMLRLEGTEKALEVGTGSGYAAAILSHLAREVHTIERHDTLVVTARRRLAQLGIRNVHVTCGDGSLGLREHAPFDAIIVSAGGLLVPPALRDQLAIGGRLVIPVHEDVDYQRLRRITRVSPDHFNEEELDEVCFVPLIGSQGWESEEHKKKILSGLDHAESPPGTRR
ncbi:MAG TPA: protein-L-isoaspartate(D-aspartate) O-methyltransferase [Candidatus Limnocylindrales bacterium]|nr:protein-L-isoaspartate(D-aspartate) O-methyltransferase [Candidatus Limnocylindrales bacterium]